MSGIRVVTVRNLFFLQTTSSSQLAELYGILIHDRVIENNFVENAHRYLIYENA